MSGPLDIFLIYQFLKRLVTPFEKWNAFKTGVIDKSGKVIVDKGNRTTEQESSWGYYDILLANLKKLLEKIPGGKTRIASFAAALLLLREENLDPENIDYLEEKMLQYMEEAKLIMEEAPVNAVGGGNIAGLGVGPQGEPGVKKKKKKSSTVLTDILRRKV